MQQVESSLTQKQQSVENTQSNVNQLKQDLIQAEKEIELKKVEINELKTLNSTLKTKLQEAQDNLKSNGDLITYLNKQLNEKPGFAGTSGPGTSTSFGMT